MKTDLFTKNAEVEAMISNLEKLNLNVSDTIDDQNNQSVDLVMEGGGVLGVALLGYTYALEKSKINFCGLAGTSAGAINSIMLAACDKGKFDTISENLLESVAAKNFLDFVDGDEFVKNIIKDLFSDKSKIWVIIRNIYRIPRLLKILKKDLGFANGDNFENWIQEILLEKGNINSVSELSIKREAMAKKLQLKPNIDGNNNFNAKIAIIASDISTQTKVEFPDHGHLYYYQSEDVNPAKYVRATMSIPFFFKPMIVSPIPKNQEKEWDDKVGFTGKIPDSVKFVDGGTLSNFPINVFHSANTVPRKPTFGVRLGKDRQKVNKTSTILKFFFAIFNTMRYLHDYDFLLRNKDYSKLIAIVDTEEHNWLNFNLSDEEKIDLFTKGVKAAHDFLIKFNWEDYKKIRREMITPNQV
jgi:NTE family protein